MPNFTRVRSGLELSYSRKFCQCDAKRKSAAEAQDHNNGSLDERSSIEDSQRLDASGRR